MSETSTEIGHRDAGRVAPEFAVGKLARAEHERPLRDLLVRLPQLVADRHGKLDLVASPPSLVLEVAQQAEASVRALNLGIAAVGNLIPYAAPEIEDGTIAMGTVEALGWLLSELGEVAASCLVLAAQCRSEVGAHASNSK